jgi:L-cystine uptake protein TcyP (sodium:dicarboxylate symporter family)
MIMVIVKNKYILNATCNAIGCTLGGITAIIVGCVLMFTGIGAILGIPITMLGGLVIVHEIDKTVDNSIKANKIYKDSNDMTIPHLITHLFIKKMEATGFLKIQNE